MLLHHTTVEAISTIQLNLPSNHRDHDNVKTVEMMYMELLKRFENGNSLKILDPIEDMQIEYDADTDEIDIKELLKAKEDIEVKLSNTKKVS